MAATVGVEPITTVAERLGIGAEHVIPHGTDKAKIATAALDAASRPPGKLILVSAITPTDAGEGKTTTSICLAQGLAKIGENVCLALREPSLGPTFGLKGGAIGGGKALLTPGADINLHFTGDFHAITSANNLLAATLDNHLHQGNALGIDPRRVSWRRVLDLNDRSLRHTMVGLGGATQGVPRETGFDITTASEVMAVLCLADGAEDLRARLSRLIVAQTYAKQPVTAEQLNVVGAMMVLLKDAVHPNLVQTIEGVPALVHGGPFANIAHGCNSVIATRMAMAHADWTVTEAGFGFDLGGEKFFDIKCRATGLNPAAVVMVATVRALKRHGGVGKKDLATPDPAAVERGLPNLQKHLENVKVFERTPIVALNRFGTDSEEEIEVVRRAAEAMGVAFALNDGFARGGDGATELAEAVATAAAADLGPLRTLYELSDSPQEKMRRIATTLYGADDVAFTKEAERAFRRIAKLGYGDLPLCVAKTPASLSDQASLVGRPEGFTITVRDAVLAAGAGFIIPMLGSILRMPGLGKSPQLERMDLVDGEVVGMA
ncbi:MAG: formate--tetrahydrofolate ligase [Acidobacteriota bacterium]